MKKRNLLLSALLFILIPYCYGQEIVNGGFEMLSQKSIARNWTFFLGKSNYKIQVDSNEKHSGKYALRLTDTLLTDNGIKREAVVANMFGFSSTEKVSTIELQGWVKFSSAKDSSIALFIQNMRGNKIILSYVKNLHQHGQEWQKIKLTFAADKDAPWYGFYYGFEISAKGKIWMDDVEIAVNGKKVIDAPGFHFEATSKDIKWLNSALSSLKKSDIGTSDDLKPIGKFIADSKIVAIGEPTHGTHEAFKFKLRAIEYLVVNKGFTTIALEEVIPTCDIMNQVVNTDNQSIRDSLMTLPFYKAWKTAEMVELLTWVGKYNHENPSKKVNFIGMDMEDIRMKTSRKLLREYGSQPIYDQVKIIDNHLDTLLKINNTSGKESETRVAADQLKNDFKNLHLLLENESKNIPSGKLLFSLKTYVRVCEQWLATRFYNASRDEFMADNIKFYAENFPEDKLVIFAHNFHVANQSAELSKTLGAYLKDYFNKQFVSIGFTSAQGNYTAATDYSQKKWSAFPFEKAYQGTYEYILAKASQDFYFLPLNHQRKQVPGAAWLSIPMKHLDNGYVQSGSDDDYKFYGNLDTVFDGIVFCKETTASHSFLIK